MSYQDYQRLWLETAARLWNEGCDTLQIATVLNCTEPEIYNKLKSIKAVAIALKKAA